MIQHYTYHISLARFGKRNLVDEHRTAMEAAKKTVPSKGNQINRDHNRDWSTPPAHIMDESLSLPMTWLLAIPHLNGPVNHENRVDPFGNKARLCGVSQISFAPFR